MSSRKKHLDIKKRLNCTRLNGVCSSWRTAIVQRENMHHLFHMPRIWYPIHTIPVHKLPVLNQPSCAEINSICILFNMSEITYATWFKLSLSRRTAVETDFALDKRFTFLASTKKRSMMYETSRYYVKIHKCFFSLSG